ncbi:hypothetical protein GF378_00595 [Candidatus Pacearchaeota archaeon]|nr:hypothetical protein [Candidatus Pacearchaeota archaeon]
MKKNWYLNKSNKYNKNKKQINLLLTSLAFFSIFLLSVSFVSAVEFEMKSEYKQGEALLAKLSGQFTKTPAEGIIEFFRGHVRIGMDHEVAKIGEDFYIFASLIGKKPDNYSVVIDDIKYRHQGEMIEEPLTKNFTIVEEFADFSINKGFISTKDDFTITVDNLKDNSIDLSLQVSTVSGNEGGLKEYEEGEEYIISVLPGEKTIDFELGSDVRSSIKNIKLKSVNQNYTIPLSIFVDSEKEVSEGKITAFDIAPTELDLTMPTNSNLTKKVYIYNTGTAKLSDVEVSLSESLKPYFQLSEDTFGQILPEDNANFDLKIVSGGEQSFSGKMNVVTAEGVSDSIKVSLKIEEGYEPKQTEQQQDITTDETCEEAGGKVCVGEEECDGEYIFAKNQFCCIGTCSEPGQSSYGKLIGWAIVLVIIAAVAWFFFKKYKKPSKPVDLLKIASGKKSFKNAGKKTDKK